MDFRKLAFILAGLSLFASLFFPYLATIFTSPQYPDTSPVVYIHPDGLRGDIHEFQVVGRYIGVKVPPELPEFDSKIFSYLIGLLAAMTLLGVLLSQRWRKIIPIILLVAGITFAGWAQYRLYQAGHTLDPTAPMRYAVKPFTPPLIGVVRIHRITIYHVPHVGFVLFGVAITLAVFAAWRTDYRKESQFDERKCKKIKDET